MPPAQGQLLLGLRGVGKTVLLNEMARQADALGFLTVVLEAPEDRRLAELLVPPLRHALFQLSRAEKAKQAAVAALGALRAFAAAFKVKVGDVQFGVEAARGTADSGDLDYDLSELVRIVATAAAGGPGRRGQVVRRATVRLSAGGAAGTRRGARRAA